MAVSTSSSSLKGNSECIFYCSLPFCLWLCSLLFLQLLLAGESSSPLDPAASSTQDAVATPTPTVTATASSPVEINLDNVVVVQEKESNSAQKKQERQQQQQQQEQEQRSSNVNDKNTIKSSSLNHQESSKNLIIQNLYDDGSLVSLAVHKDPLVSIQTRTTAAAASIKVYERAMTVTTADPKNNKNKILVLNDNIPLLSTVDPAAYAEMMAHIPMGDHAKPQRVLVISGSDGDGCVACGVSGGYNILNEILKHGSVQQVDFVCSCQDQDEYDDPVMLMMMDIWKQHFALNNHDNDIGSMNWEKNPRVTLHAGVDGVTFVQSLSDINSDKNKKQRVYDVIILEDYNSSSSWKKNKDNNDNEDNKEEEASYFLKNLFDRLSKQGVLLFSSTTGATTTTTTTPTATTSSSPSLIKTLRKEALDSGFPTVRYGTFVSSSLLSLGFGFFLCNKQKKPVLPGGTGALVKPSVGAKKLQARFQKLLLSNQNNNNMQYYHPRLQSSCFDLPYAFEQDLYNDKLEMVVQET